MHKITAYYDVKYDTGLLRKLAKGGIAFQEQPQQTGQGDRVAIRYRPGAGSISHAGEAIRTMIVQAMNNCGPAILVEAVKLAEAAELRAAQAAEAEAREVLEAIDKGVAAAAVQ